MKLDSVRITMNTTTGESRGFFSIICSALSFISAYSDKKITRKIGQSHKKLITTWYFKSGLVKRQIMVSRTQKKSNACLSNCHLQCYCLYLPRNGLFSQGNQTDASFINSPMLIIMMSSWLHAAELYGMGSL